MMVVFTRQAGTVFGEFLVIYPTIAKVATSHSDEFGNEIVMESVLLASCCAVIP
jgi:hypothetical protein